MIDSMKNKYLPCLIGFGLLCLIFGCTRLYIEQVVEIASSSLISLGVILLLISYLNIYLKKKRTGSEPSQKLGVKTGRKRAVLAASIVIISVVMIVGVNYLAHSLPYRWDVTAAKQHTLTKSTVDYLAGSTRALKLTALHVGLPPKYLVDQLNEYKRISGGEVTVEIIDPIEQIGLAAQYGNVINGRQKKLIVQSGDERRDIDFTKDPLTEEQVINAIVRVTREKRKVYFLTGHGEYDISSEDNQGLSYFSTLLNSNNIISKTLMLGMTNTIPEDCDVLIVAGPRSELTEHEYGVIKGYLGRGGDAFFLVEQGEAPTMNRLLNNWGLHVGNDVVVDLNNHIQSDVSSPATKNYLPHKAITEGLDYTFYVRPRSIAELEERRPSIKMVPIVLTETNSQSWAETDLSSEIHYDDGVDKPGPIPISYVVLEEESNTRLIVFTDVDFLSNAYIKQYGNAAMGLNVVNWLSELDHQVVVGKEHIFVERLDLTSKQRRMVAAVLFLIPLFIALVGVAVWLKRR